jgi:hypothetical protein
MKLLKSLFVIHCSLFIMFATMTAQGATIVASINGAPITDADITARVRLMTAQGQSYADNRKRALQNIIDDNVRLKYAENFQIKPSDADAKKELKAMERQGLDLSSFSATDMEMAVSAIKANMAWQAIIARTIMPTISVSKEEIAAEVADLERARGLPMDITFIRLINIPESVAAKLSTPKDCDNAMKMAEDLGGAPQKITAPHYELAEDIRVRMTGLATLKWSSVKDDSVILICSKKKMKEYAKLDEMIEQNATWKKAMFQGDQQLKQLRRKAVVVIMDEKYK